MDVSFKTMVHRFGISKGLLLENPRNVAVAEGAGAAGSRRSRGALYVLVEILGGLADPDNVLRRLLEIVEEEYYAASGSVTGGISQALRAANDWLFEENLNSPREQRGVAGMSCAVLRGGDLYLGQMGPALAYLAQADGLRRFPEDSPWLRQPIPSDSERAAAPPLGVRRVIEPLFYHATPDAGDVLVLASPSLARLAMSRTLAQVIGQGGEVAKHQLQMIASGRDLSALIVTLAARAEAPLSEDAGFEDLEEVGEETPEAGREPLGTVLAWGEVAREKLADAWEGAQGPLGRAGTGLLSLLKGTLPDRSPRRAMPRGQAQRPRRGASQAKAVAVLAIMIPIVALLLVVGSRYQFERTRRSQATELFRQANEARTSGLNSAQKEVQREHLERAVALLDQILELAPNEPGAVALRQQVVGELDMIGNVRRLYTLWELADLSAGTAEPVTPTRIIVRGSDVFVLDPGADRAFWRRLSPAGDGLEPLSPSSLLVQKGELRGPISVGELVDMVWMPVGGQRQSANLLIVERNGSLLEWDPSRGIAVLPAADAATWRKPQAAGAYSGNFYLLDPQQNRILKYVPAAGGYTNPPVDYVLDGAAVDLSGAVDMAIDGHIYVLLADGTVCKFLAGQLQDFEMKGLDTPLKHPVALFVSGEGEAQGYVYVADAGLARVVQFTKQGAFVSQFKAAEGQAQLDELRGLFVDEANQRIYLTSGPRLYMAPTGATSEAAPGDGEG